MVRAGTARTETYKSVAIGSPWSSSASNQDPDPHPGVRQRQRAGDRGCDRQRRVRLTDLRERYPKILCEGGPRLFSTLLEEGLSTSWR